MQGEDGDFGSDIESKPPAVADALVHVDRGTGMMAQPGGESAGVLADEQAADAGPVHLTAVRVAAEHQVAALVADVLDRERVVRQDEARGLWAQPPQRAHGVTLAGPEVVDPRDLERLAGLLYYDRFVAQDPYAAGFQGRRDRLVKPAVAPKPHGVAHREVVVAEYGIDTERGPQPAQRRRHVVDVVVTLVNEVACKGDQVWFVGQRPLDDLGQIVRGEVVPAMEVGQVCDPEAVQGQWQVADRQRDSIGFEPGRLHLAAVAQSGPGASHPAGGRSPGRSWQGQGRTELRHSKGFRQVWVGQVIGRRLPQFTAATGRRQIRGGNLEGLGRS